MPAGGLGEGAGGVVEGYLVAGHVVPCVTTTMVVKRANGSVEGVRRRWRLLC